MPDEIFDVFLSHNSKDKPVVRQIAEALRSRGLRVWLDERELIPGRRWISELERNLDRTRTVWWRPSPCCVALSKSMRIP